MTIAKDRLIGSSGTSTPKDLVQRLIDDWPNTYSLTKAVVEEQLCNDTIDQPSHQVFWPVMLGSPVDGNKSGLRTKSLADMYNVRYYQPKLRDDPLRRIRYDFDLYDGSVVQVVVQVVVHSHSYQIYPVCLPMGQVPNYMHSRFQTMDPAEIIMEEAKKRQKPIFEAAARGDSEIQQFFSDTTVLVTGGTGFLGKLLIEKLIRSCNVHTIYAILRPKKGMAIKERMGALLKDSVFDTLREINPNFGDKINPIEGDVAELGVGLSAQNWDTLAQEVNFIFHMAATTRFDDILSKATLINVRGTRELLTLAKQCRNLRSFVHVSTAYCQATRDRINSEVLEKFYPSPINPDALIGMAESMEKERLVAITNELINGWPNTYTFTKAVAEELLRCKDENLPACIVRPPIVIGSHDEPSPGWNDPSCVYGATGWFLTSAIGVSHVVLKDDIHLSMGPADYVTNAVIASARETRIRQDNNNKELMIYTTCRPLYDLGEGIKFICSKRCRSLITPKAIWYCWAIETKNKFIFWLLFWILHYIPAYLIDTIFFLLRLKLPQGIPSVVRLYTKIYKMSMVLSYFLINEWFFKDDNTVDLYNKLSATDKILFNFDFGSIVWNDYMMRYGLGVRKYIIKDGLKNSDKGVRKQFWLKIANFLYFAIFAYFVFKVFYNLYNTIQYVM